MSVTVSVDYLSKLSSRRGPGRSRLADLYLARAFIEFGRLDLAASPLERFLADDAAPEKEKVFARIDMGLLRALKGDRVKAEELWSGVDTGDPEIRSHLAAAYMRAGVEEKNPAAMIEEALGGSGRKRGLSMRLIANALSVYRMAGMTEKGLALANGADLKVFSYIEAIGKSKVINFYDVSILKDLSGIFLDAAIKSLERAAEDSRLKDTANFYLGEALALAGKTDKAIVAMDAFISASQMPQQLRDRAAARQAANYYRKGRKSDAMVRWEELSQKQPEDPEVIAAVLSSCADLKIDCPKPLKKAADAMEKAEGRRY